MKRLQVQASAARGLGAMIAMAIVVGAIVASLALAGWSAAQAIEAKQELVQARTHIAELDAKLGASNQTAATLQADVAQQQTALRQLWATEARSRGITPDALRNQVSIYCRVVPVC
jgi:septal ring factor EnvC (AmiA/AmiB activator)